MGLLLLSAILILSLVMIVFGFPGLWVMIAAAAGYTILDPSRPISWFSIAGIVILAVIAEVLEFSLAGKYARKYGGSRRAGWGAIIGGMVGAFAGVPIPIIGSVIGAFVGSFAGALIAELSRGTASGDATKVATGALIGRLVATALKVGIGCTLAVWIFLAAMN